MDKKLLVIIFNRAKEYWINKTAEALLSNKITVMKQVPPRGAKSCLNIS
jgi:hypothetical protein